MAHTTKLTRARAPIETPVYPDVRVDPQTSKVDLGRVDLRWANFFSQVEKRLDALEQLSGPDGSGGGIGSGANAAVPQRSIVQFTGGVTIKDDPTNKRTIVDVFDVDDLRAADGDGSGIDADTVRGIEVDDLERRFRILVLHLAKLGIPLPPELEDDFTIAAAEVA